MGKTIEGLLQDVNAASDFSEKIYLDALDGEKSLSLKAGGGGGGSAHKAGKKSANKAQKKIHFHTHTGDTAVSRSTTGCGFDSQPKSQGVNHCKDPPTGLIDWKLCSGEPPSSEDTQDLRLAIGRKQGKRQRKDKQIKKSSAENFSRQETKAH